MTVEALAGADLAGADLAGADLAGADLAGADFSTTDEGTEGAFDGRAAPVPAPVGAESPHALPPSVSFMPGKIRLGSSPTTLRLSWYSFCQPPLTLCSAAIFDR
ncbi:pentapeptide repeat-containing protein [Streptomyces sp. NPDC051644]|uniref:pentapeptide repeat-containing protein n=1 Tax=Streptomyces sp. NPDC051644 TaxID=3365666 RepID=UPI00379EE399